MHKFPLVEQSRPLTPQFVVSQGPEKPWGVGSGSAEARAKRRVVKMIEGRMFAEGVYMDGRTKFEWMRCNVVKLRLID